MNVRRVSLPDGHDPNSFFVQGGDARQFQSLLEAPGHDISRYSPAAPTNPARCPFRVVEQTTGREVDWINQYPRSRDRSPPGGSSPCEVMRTSCCTFSAGGRAFITPTRSAKDALTESTLLDYVRFQSGQQPQSAGATINQRVAIVDRALRIVFPDAPGQIAPGFQQTYWRRAPMGIGRPRPALSRLRVKTPNAPYPAVGG